MSSKAGLGGNGRQDVPRVCPSTIVTLEGSDSIFSLISRVAASPHTIWFAYREQPSREMGEEVVYSLFCIVSSHKILLFFLSLFPLSLSLLSSSRLLLLPPLPPQVFQLRLDLNQVLALYVTVVYNKVHPFLQRKKETYLMK